MKAIVLTYAPISDKEEELLRNTDVFKIACNTYRAELKPNVRLCADNIVDDCLECDTCDVVSINYDLNKNRVVNGSYLPVRHSSLVSCCDYLIINGFTHILLVATNTQEATQQLNLEGLKTLEDLAYIYKYSDDGVFDLPTKSIEEFLNMNIENMILGIKEDGQQNRLLSTLAFSDSYNYKVKTVGYDNESIVTGYVIGNILSCEDKQRILNGEITIISNGLEITRITGIKLAEKTVEKALTYEEMKKFVKANNIQVKSMKKADLEQAIKEFKENE